MAVVNTNIAASIAQAALARNERSLNDAMEQLSTGRKSIQHQTMLLDCHHYSHDFADSWLRSGD